MKALIIAAFIVTALFVADTINLYMHCDGQLVRGIIGFVCIGNWFVLFLCCKIYKTKIGALKYAEKLLKTCAVGDIVQVIWSDYKTAGVLVSWRIVPQEM